jgi:hypothetical protein
MRDDFSEDVKRVIAHRANLICSNPDCGSSTGGPQEDPSKALNIGVAAHITAASSGGPRYNQTLTAEIRKSAENGIWLCQNCAKLVDNDESRFPAKVLDAWKTLREHSALFSIGQTNNRPTESESQRKFREISQWKGQRVMLVKMANSQQVMSLGIRPWSPIHVMLLDCTEFYVKVMGDGWDRSRSIPMRNVEIGYDDRFNCIELLEYDR